MNQIVKALKEMEAYAGKSGRWNLEALCKMAALEIEVKAKRIAELEAANDNTNALLDEQGTHINEQALKIAHLTKINAELTAAHEMQGEELVTLPRHMVIGLEDKLKAQAEEIRTLKQELAERIEEDATRARES